MEKYKLYLSTDGKCTLEINADHSDALINAYNKIEPFFKAKIVGLAKESQVKTYKPQAQTDTKPVETKKFCSIHGGEMRQFTSKKTGKPFWSHKNEDGSYCYGK